MSPVQADAFNDGQIVPAGGRLWLLLTGVWFVVIKTDFDSEPWLCEWMWWNKLYYFCYLPHCPHCPSESTGSNCSSSPSPERIRRKTFSVSDQHFKFKSKRKDINLTHLSIHHLVHCHHCCNNPGFVRIDCQSQVKSRLNQWNHL